jgi:hypothetical protein
MFCIFFWVFPYVLLEGCSLKVEGTADWAFSQGSIIRSWKSPFAQSHGKSSHDFDLFVSWHSIKEEVVSEAARFTVLCVLNPCPSISLECASINCCLTGSQSSSKVNHEVILLGSGTIWSAVEAERGRGNGAFGLVLCRTDWHPRRGCLLGCSWLMGTIGCILKSHLISTGRCDWEQVWAWFRLGYGTSRLWWKFYFRSHLSDVKLSVIKRGGSCHSWVGLQGCQSTE